jgi:hypothetical protein
VSSKKPLQFLGKFARLSGVQRYWLVRAWLRVLCVRFALWVLPLDKVRALFAPKRRAKTPESSVPLSCVVGSVLSVSRIVPQSTCLVRAIALQSLLHENGQKAQLHIGVALDSQNQFLAHAWVEYQGQTILGGQNQQYQSLLTLET